MPANPVYDLLAPLLAPVPLVRSHQDAPAKARPYATYRVTRNASPRHAVSTPPDDAGGVLLRSHRALAVEVQCYGPGSEGATDRLPDELRRETVTQHAETLGLSIAAIGPAQHVPSLLDSARWEERGIVEFSLYALAEVADTPGLIEHVGVDGEWRDESGDDMPTVTVTGTVRPPPPAAGQSRGVVSLEFLGAVVEAGFYAVLPSAPYPLTPVALDHEVGATGGSFTATLVVLRAADPAREAPAGVADLTVDAAARRTVEIPAAARVALAAGDRLAVRIADVAGEPSGALITVHFTH